MITFDFQHGTFVPSQGDLDKVTSLLAAVRDRRYGHNVFAQNLFGPIRTRAVYVSWTQDLFYTPTSSVSPSGEFPRVAVSDYVATAWMTSPDGTVSYVRPGRRYLRPTFQMVKAGMEISWYDLESAGWDMLNYHIGETGEEIAAKVDGMAKAVLDAAISSSNTVNVPGTLTKAAVDYILKLAAANKFPIRLAVINPALIMDMSNWQIPLNWMWSNLPTAYGNQIVRQGYITDYGGITWIVRDWAPADAVYFSGPPQEGGQYHFLYGAPRVDSAEDIDNGVTRYAFREQHGFLIAGGMALYKINIT